MGVIAALCSCVMRVTDACCTPASCCTTSRLASSVFFAWSEPLSASMICGVSDGGGVAPNSAKVPSIAHAIEMVGFI